MEKFTTLSAIAAPLDQDNIDTDIIYPGIYLRTMKRSGLADFAFQRLRFDEDGLKKPDFVLNKPEYAAAQILVTGANFGCGSSREHAPWALLDMGFRCIIAPSFADIFYSNSLKNGILPIELPQQQIDQLMQQAQNNPAAPITVDLEKQIITRGNQFSFAFDIDPFRKDCLLNGLDDIALTSQKSAAIAAYETKKKDAQPWV